MTATSVSVRDNGQIRKLAAYVILTISPPSHNEVLSIYVDENESTTHEIVKKCVMSLKN